MDDDVDGDIFIDCCTPEDCDGSHIIIAIGREDGEEGMARHVTDIDGALELAKALVDLVAEMRVAQAKAVGRLN